MCWKPTIEFLRKFGNVCINSRPGFEIKFLTSRELSCLPRFYGALKICFLHPIIDAISQEMPLNSSVSDLPRSLKNCENCDCYDGNCACKAGWEGDYWRVFTYKNR